VKLLDFSAELIDPPAIKAAGYDGVIGYFSDSRPGANFGVQPLRRDYRDRLRALRSEIVSNCRYGKGATSDWLGGFDGSVRHAEIALKYHTEAGGPGKADLRARRLETFPRRVEFADRTVLRGAYAKNLDDPARRRGRRARRRAHRDQIVPATT
jgi:hypothetical protein